MNYDSVSLRYFHRFINTLASFSEGMFIFNFVLFDYFNNE